MKQLTAFLFCLLFFAQGQVFGQKSKFVTIYNKWLNQYMVALTDNSAGIGFTGEMPNFGSEGVFEMIPQGGEIYALKAKNGKYLQGPAYGTMEIMANAEPSHENSWARFRFLPRPDGSFMIITNSGSFFSARRGNRLYADQYLYQNGQPLTGMYYQVYPSTIINAGELFEIKEINAEVRGELNQRPKFWYVGVQTGTKSGSGTDANVSIWIDKLNRWLPLDSPGDDFENGSFGVYQICSYESLKPPFRFAFKLEGNGTLDADWYLDSVMFGYASPETENPRERLAGYIPIKLLLYPNNQPTLMSQYGN